MIKRKRKCSLFSILAFIVVLFILSLWRSHELLQPKSATTREKTGLIHEKRKYDMTQNKVKSVTDLQKATGRSTLNTTKVAGVEPSKLKFYQPDSHGKFTCIDGTQQIGMMSVNDDYCDCHDGSDEPGTDACPNTMFYCSPQKIFLPSSRVNDGICDCCDGSDEWKQLNAGEHILYYSPKVHYSPCTDFCFSDFKGIK